MPRLGVEDENAKREKVAKKKKRRIKNELLCCALSFRIFVHLECKFCSKLTARIWLH